MDNSQIINELMNHIAVGIPLRSLLVQETAASEKELRTDVINALKTKLARYESEYYIVGNWVGREFLIKPWSYGLMMPSRRLLDFFPNHVTTAIINPFVDTGLVCKYLMSDDIKNGLISWNNAVIPSTFIITGTGDNYGEHTALTTRQVIKILESIRLTEHSCDLFVFSD